MSFGGMIPDTVLNALERWKIGREDFKNRAEYVKKNRRQLYKVYSFDLTSGATAEEPLTIIYGGGFVCFKSIRNASYQPIAGVHIGVKFNELEFDFIPVSCPEVFATPFQEIYISVAPTPGAFLDVLVSTDVDWFSQLATNSCDQLQNIAVNVNIPNPLPVVFAPANNASGGPYPSGAAYGIMIAANPLRKKLFAQCSDNLLGAGQAVFISPNSSDANSFRIRNPFFHPGAVGQFITSYTGTLFARNNTGAGTIEVDFWEEF